MSKSIKFAPIFIAMLIAAAAPASADPVADFYRGRTVTVIVPSGSGGTFHLYGQLVSRHIGRYIPGNPTVIVQNRPGAGGVKAANYMANAAPRDGTVIAEINPGSVIVPMMRKVRFDPRAFRWLGAVTVRTYTLAVWSTVKADTIDEIKKTPVIMGASGRGSSNYQIPTFLNKAIGTRFKVISGYKGGGAINLAMERGEVQGRGNYFSGYTGAKPGWIREGKVKFLAYAGPPRPEVKDVPRLRDLVGSARERRMFDLLSVAFDIGQAFYVPPGVPADRVAALRDAFLSMVKDPAMQAEAMKRRVPVNWRTYRQVESVIARAYATPPEVVKRLAKMLGLDKRRKRKNKKK